MSAVSDAIRSGIFGDWGCAAVTNTTSVAAVPNITFHIDRPGSLDAFIVDHSAAIRHR
jgi:hypothetical protein